MMTAAFKVSVYKSTLNKNEKKYLVNISNQYTADEQSTLCVRDERFAKLKIQRQEITKELKTVNMDLILSIYESALSDHEKEYLIAVSEGAAVNESMAKISKKIACAGAFASIRK